MTTVDIVSRPFSECAVDIHRSAIIHRAGSPRHRRHRRRYSAGGRLGARRGAIAGREGEARRRDAPPLASLRSCHPTANILCGPPVADAGSDLNDVRIAVEHMLLCRLAFGPHLGAQLAWFSALSKRGGTDRFRSKPWSVSIDVAWLSVVPNAAFEALHSVRGHVAVLSAPPPSHTSLLAFSLDAAMERARRLGFGRSSRSSRNSLGPFNIRRFLVWRSSSVADLSPSRSSSVAASSLAFAAPVCAPGRRGLGALARPCSTKRRMASPRDGRSSCFRRQPSMAAIHDLVARISNRSDKAGSSFAMTTYVTYVDAA